MRCPHCGHDTVIGASDYVPADLDCLHCGRQLDADEVDRAPDATPEGEWGVRDRGH
jgi:transcription initiation factor TFIIIB Brf1 subunit/transcription initiation factor TFIIB